MVRDGVVPGRLGVGQRHDAVQDRLPLGVAVEPGARVGVLALHPLRHRRIADVLHVLVVVGDLLAPIGVDHRVLRRLGWLWTGGLRRTGDRGIEEAKEE